MVDPLGAHLLGVLAHMQRHPLQNHHPEVHRREHKWIVSREGLNSSSHEPILMCIFNNVRLLGFWEKTTLIDKLVLLLE